MMAGPIYTRSSGRSALQGITAILCSLFIAHYCASTLATDY